MTWDVEPKTKATRAGISLGVDEPWISDQIDQIDQHVGNDVTSISLRFLRFLEDAVLSCTKLY